MYICTLIVLLEFYIMQTEVLLAFEKRRLIWGPKIFLKIFLDMSQKFHIKVIKWKRVDAHTLEKNIWLYNYSVGLKFSSSTQNCWPADVNYIKQI